MIRTAAYPLAVSAYVHGRPCAAATIATQLVTHLYSTGDRLVQRDPPRRIFAYTDCDAYREPCPD